MGKILTIVIVLAIGVYVGAKNPGLVAKVGL